MSILEHGYQQRQRAMSGGVLAELRREKENLIARGVPYERTFMRQEHVFLDGLTVHSRGACETRWCTDPTNAPGMMKPVVLTVNALVDGPWDTCSCFHFTGAVHHDLLALGLHAAIIDASCEPRPLDAAASIHNVLKRARFVAVDQQHELLHAASSALDRVRPDAVRELDERASLQPGQSHGTLGQCGTHHERPVAEREIGQVAQVLEPRVLFLSRTTQNIRPQSLAALYEAVFTVDVDRYAGICARHTATLIGDAVAWIEIDEQYADAALSLALQLWDSTPGAAMNNPALVLDVVAALLDQ